MGATSTRGTAVTGATGPSEVSTPRTGQTFPPLAYGFSSKTRNRSSRRRRRRRRAFSTSEARSYSSMKGYDWNDTGGLPAVELRLKTQPEDGREDGILQPANEWHKTRSTQTRVNIPRGKVTGYRERGPTRLVCLLPYVPVRRAD